MRQKSGYGSAAVLAALLVGSAFWLSGEPSGSARQPGSFGEYLEQVWREPSNLVQYGSGSRTQCGGGLKEVSLCMHASVPAAPVVKEIKLFNGKDLTNFYTYLGAPKAGAAPYGKNNDPEKVFSVKDGMIRVSGKVFGGLVTEKEYENYRLVVEYKWGEETWPPRDKAARDSGILLHCVGEDGAAGGVWLESIECQMIEGGTGDFILVRGKGQPTLTVRAEKRDGQSYYAPKAESMLFKGGRINWFARDPAWKDVKGFRGPHDLEKAVGEWNRLECVCNGGRITNILNGIVANDGTEATPQRGRILFQSEGAEVFFRRIDLALFKGGK